MDSSTHTKMVGHGVTVINTAPSANPPPYSGPTQSGFYPQPGYAAPVHTVHYGPGTYGHPGVHGQTAMIHTVTPAVIVTQQMGPRPVHVSCKSCHAEIVTRVEANPNTRTHLFALMFCLLGCWPCVCLPYCMDDCMSASHYCPNCNAYVGGYMN